MKKNEPKIIGCVIETPQDINTILKKVEAHKKKYDTFLQLFNADLVIGKDHLLWAYDKAKRGFKQNTNRAESMEIETLLWASGERQIKNAIKIMGIPKDSRKAVIMMEKGLNEFLEMMEWERDDTLVEPSLEKLHRFGIKKEKIELSEEPYDLIFEKMSTSVFQ